MSEQPLQLAGQTASACGAMTAEPNALSESQAQPKPIFRTAACTTFPACQAILPICTMATHPPRRRIFIHYPRRLPARPPGLIWLTGPACPTAPGNTAQPLGSCGFFDAMFAFVKTERPPSAMPCRAQSACHFWGRRFMILTYDRQMQSLTNLRVLSGVVRGPANLVDYVTCRPDVVVVRIAIEPFSVGCVVRVAIPRRANAETGAMSMAFLDRGRQQRAKQTVAEFRCPIRQYRTCINSSIESGPVALMLGLDPDPAASPQGRKK
jgi:hypothetical protein